MQKFLQTIIDLSLTFRQFIIENLGPYLPFIHGVSIVISALLLWGIIYFIFSSGWLRFKYDQWTDVLGSADIGRRRQLRGWKQILKRLKTENMSNWKLAVLEADKILDEIFKMSGYRGETVHDRFAQITPEVLSNIEKINQAHRVRDRIKQEPDFVITKEEAIEIAKIYQQSFQELGLID